MHLVHTGVPETTTGECVSRVKENFGDSNIWNEFEAVTNAMEKALATNSLEDIQSCIRENNRLLAGIGVVPGRVQEFISEVEKSGAAAKICGAGAVAGDKGGIVMVCSERTPKQLCDKYGYDIVSVRGEPLGARIV